MAIRLRVVDGLMIACCAAETDQEPGDVYLDDEQHYALAAKFSRDWRGRGFDVVYDDHDAANETQRRRVDREVHAQWAAEARARRLRRVQRWLDCRAAFRSTA